MTVQYIQMPIYSDSFYSYTIGLEEQSFKWQVLWNERGQFWSYSLYLEDGTPLVLGERLVPNYPISFDYPIEELTGFFLLVPTSEINAEAYLSYPRDLDQYYELYYVYDNGE